MCKQDFNGGNLKARDRFESPSVNGIILKRILNDGEAWTESALVQVLVEGCCESGYEPSRSTGSGEYLN